MALERLSMEEIEELREAMMEHMNEKLASALVILNQSGQLDELLRLLDMGNLTDAEEPLRTYAKGRIVVIGDTATKPKDLIGIAKDLGIDKRRIEFIGFDESHRFDYRSLEYNPLVCAVLFGAVPHKTKGTNESSSVIAYMEARRDRYPMVLRLTAGECLKITKTNFKHAIENLIETGLLAAYQQA
ncbi:MAG: hypothetical protein JJE36_02880 [Coriobacteriia bacterium]|nr:hypothetical protein [Coriobacteriia bacterium]